MPLSREQKAELLNDLVDKFSKAKSVSFSDYRGLSVNEMQELRGKLREKGMEYKVAKKTLFRLACKEAGIKEIPDEALEGPIGAAFSYEDEVAPFRVISVCSKEWESLQLLGGIMEGNGIGVNSAKELASLPSKEELLAKLVGSMKAPISGFHGVLHGVMRKFVGTMDAVRAQKEEASA